MGLLPAAREVLLGIEQGQPVPKALEGRLRPNTAMGGARPKLTVEHDGRLWLAKLPSSRDDQSLPDAKLEAAMLALGVLCGINTAKAQVVLGDVLLVERFDRAWVDGPEPGWRRDSFLSARTIFNASVGVQTYAAGGYGRLATELLRYSTDPQADQKELFRRMVFNVCISNTDALVSGKFLMLISEQIVLRLKHLDLFAVKGVGDHLLECDFLEHIDLHEMQEVAQRNT